MYGHKNFGPAGIVLKVYAPGFLLLCMNVSFGYVVFAVERTRAFSLLKVASVIVNTALELVLIPVFQQQMGNGGIGAVAAFVVSEFMVFAGVIYLLRREGVSRKIPIDIARALGAAALTLLLFWWMPPLPFFIGVPVCVAAFSLCSVGLGLVRWADIQLFQALLRIERSRSQSTTTR